MNRDEQTQPDAAATPAAVVREYGPFGDARKVNGVSYDGRRVWVALGEAMLAIDPQSGEPLQTIEHVADAGTAFDGKFLWQIAGDRIDKIDPESGEVLTSIAAPGPHHSGLAWAEGSLWVGEHHGRRIMQVDPVNGAVLRTIESNRFVTGVTWVDGELWHGTWEGEESEIRRVDPVSGEVLERLTMPPGTGVSGLESDGGDVFYAGGGESGTVRAVRRPKRAPSLDRSTGGAKARRETDS